MPALQDIDTLSDDPRVSPEKPKDPKGPASGSPKAKPKTKAKAKNKPVKEKSPKVKEESAPMPEVRPTTPVLKRPAALAEASGGTSSPSKVMKRPAGRAKDPDHISTCKSRYKIGVYTIKLFGKEVIRVKPDPNITEEDLDQIATAVRDELIRTKGDVAAAKALQESMTAVAKNKTRAPHESPAKKPASAAGEELPLEDGDGAIMDDAKQDDSGEGEEEEAIAVDQEVEEIS